MPRKFRKRGRSVRLVVLLSHVGGDAALAKLLGISKQAIGLWDEIPDGRLDEVRSVLKKDAVVVSR